MKYTIIVLISAVLMTTTAVASEKAATRIGGAFMFHTENGLGGQAVIERGTTNWRPFVQLGIVGGNQADDENGASYFWGLLPMMGYGYSADYQIGAAVGANCLFITEANSDSGSRRYNEIAPAVGLKLGIDPVFMTGSVDANGGVAMSFGLSYEFEF